MTLGNDHGDFQSLKHYCQLFPCHKDDKDPLNHPPIFHAGFRHLFHYFQSADIFK